MEPYVNAGLRLSVSAGSAKEVIQYQTAELCLADRWLIQYGKQKDAMAIVGRAGTRANAAQVAQDHFDRITAEEGRERIVFDPDDPAGEFCCADGWYRITRIGSGQWRRVV